MDLEAAAPEEARSAYAKALALEPDLAEAHVNLGRLLQLDGRTAEAAEHYRRSLVVGRSDPTAAFNLGTALEELGRWVVPPTPIAGLCEKTLSLPTRISTWLGSTSSWAGGRRQSGISGRISYYESGVRSRESGAKRRTPDS